MTPRKRKQNADEKAPPEVTAAERAAVEKYRAKKKPEPNAAKPHDKMTAQERNAIDRFLARNAANPAPRLKVLNGKQAVSISPDHPDNLTGQMLLMDALGTADFDFFNGLLDQLANAGSKGGQIDGRRLNFMLSVVKGIQPRDQLEVMLAAQMAAVHMATMTFARRLAHVEDIAQQDSAERAFNKLSRTFTTQMEALKRYRTGGEQKVTVQHVSVAGCPARRTRLPARKHRCGSPKSNLAAMQSVLWEKRFACAIMITGDSCCDRRASCAAACRRIRIISPLHNRVHSGAV